MPIRKFGIITQVFDFIDFRFYGPVNTIKVMLSTVSYPTQNCSWAALDLLSS